MKIVHLEDFFHPNAGYQINILPKYQSRMGNKVTIVTSQIEKLPKDLIKFFGEKDIEVLDKIYEETTGVKIIRVPIHKFISGRSIYKRGLKKKIESLRPDILYIHGNDTAIGIYYTIIHKKFSFPIIFDSHMLDMASNNKLKSIFRRFYRFFIAPIIKKNKITIIRTQNDDYLEKHLSIPISLSPWISTGSDTLLFNYDEEKKTKYRKEYGLTSNDFVFIYTGKLDDSKGGLLLAQAFKEKFVTNNGKNVVLIVVGNSPEDEYGGKVENALEKSENLIIRVPTQTYSNLPKFYQLSDISIFPKQCSLSFYDAQACGLPVISEDNNINIDRLRFNNGINFKKNDIEDLRKKVEYLTELNSISIEVMKKNAIHFIKENYDYSNIAEQFNEILIENININKRKLALRISVKNNKK